MPAPATMIPPQQLADAARAPIIAYNDKNWDAVRSSVTADFVYDEVASHRKVEGVEQAITLWQGWAAAFPDSKAVFHNTLVSGDSVVLEVTWQGTHKGPLQTPSGPVAPTGRRIEIPACIVIELTGTKARLQRHYFDMATLMQQLGIPA
ncbi:MAG TPA: ester cyclase [Gemmatimonadales bacterium]|nr:ester cyclase [Gemmatimonadales bacterium]